MQPVDFRGTNEIVLRQTADSVRLIINLATPVADVEIGVVTFFSPSAVDRWVDLLGPGALAATAVCIGPSTAARARARGFTTVVTADPHTEAGVVESVGLGAPLP